MVITVLVVILATILCVYPRLVRHVDDVYVILKSRLETNNDAPLSDT